MAITREQTARDLELHRKQIVDLQERIAKLEKRAFGTANPTVSPVKKPRAKK